MITYLDFAVLGFTMLCKALSIRGRVVMMPLEVSATSLLRKDD